VCKVTHAGVAAAFLGFLRRAAEEAMFVCVFAAVFFDTSILESAEDGVWTIVFCQVFLVLCQFGLVIVEFGFCGLELRLCVGDEFGFRGVVGSGVCENAVFDEEDAEVTEFRVDPVAYGGREIFFEFVDWVVLERDLRRGMLYVVVRLTNFNVRFSSAGLELLPLDGALRVRLQDLV
jgi:hypothetical protein